MTPGPFVLVGATNWQHPAWRGRFYPDGMPDDWMLSYYNTQFRAVFLSTEMWQTVPDEVWRQWLHDTREDFFFVLEAGDEDVAYPASERIFRAMPSWEVAHIWWLDETPDLRLLSQRIGRQAITGEPLFVFSRSGNLELMEQADTLRQVLGY